jgi:hypothetical protein
MTFQSTVRTVQTAGIVGEVVFDGPQRAEPKILRSTDADLNIIGRAFTQDPDLSPDASNIVVAGGTGVFAGILVNPLVYATGGTAAGALQPTLVLPNETNVEVLVMGTIIVDLSTDANIGDDVHFVEATGVLLAVAPGTTPAVGNAVVPNTRVTRQNIPAPGLAYIQLTN